MSAFVIAEIDVHRPDLYEDYKVAAPPSIAQYGGRYIVRGGPSVTLEGDWQPKRVVVLEFPSLEQARAWWSSSEYADAKAMRRASASTRMIAVEGLR
jgi:uncharacterized protein (DUF1330 family)